MKLCVIAVGRLDARLFAPAAAEYEKRLGRFADVRTIELAESRLPKNPSGGDIARALEEEGARILSHIAPGDAVTALCVEGEPSSSAELAETLARHMQGGDKRLVFVVGSSWGLSQGVRARADARLSMSAMTFPHQLARVMLLEQLYRAMTIVRGQTYHK